ncbi:hypothetical protein MMC32_008251 [Xylographa parallela]|nr:hypothetical protein [Xylographa parallela]
MAEAVQTPQQLMKSLLQEQQSRKAAKSQKDEPVLPRKSVIEFGSLECAPDVNIPASKGAAPQQTLPSLVYVLDSTIRPSDINISASKATAPQQTLPSLVYVLDSTIRPSDVNISASKATAPPQTLPSLECVLDDTIRPSDISIPACKATALPQTLPSLECVPDDTIRPSDVSIPASKATALPQTLPSLECVPDDTIRPPNVDIPALTQLSIVWTFIWTLIRAITFSTTLLINLMQGVWLILEVLRKYWWLGFLCCFIWPKSTTDTISKLLKGSSSMLDTPLSLDSPSGTMLRSLTDYSRTLDMNSGMYSVPSLMHKAEMDVLTLNNEIGYTNLASLQNLPGLCRDYARLSQKVLDQLEELFFLHNAGGRKLVLVAAEVTKWLENIAMEDRQRSYISSALDFASGYDVTRVGVSKVYSYLFPETIAILESILDPLSSLITDIKKLEDLILQTQEYIAYDGEGLKREHEKFQEKSFLRFFGFYNAQYRKSEHLVQMLGNITALIAIPQTRLMNTQQKLRFARNAFRELRTDIGVKVPTEFVQMVSRSELIEELNIGSQAITDSLRRIEEESILYTASIYNDIDNSSGTSIPKHRQRTLP